MTKIRNTRTISGLRYHRTDSEGRIFYQLSDKMGDFEGSVIINRKMELNVLKGIKHETMTMTVVLESEEDVGT